jgi:hypothetical protein
MQRKGKENKQGDTKLTRNMRDISSFKRKRKIKLIYMLTTGERSSRKSRAKRRELEWKASKLFLMHTKGCP